MAKKTFLQLQEEVCWHCFGSDDTTIRSANELGQVKRAINLALRELAIDANLTAFRRRGFIILAEGVQTYQLPERTKSILDGTIWFEDESDTGRPMVNVPEQDMVRCGARASTRAADPYTITDVNYDPDAERYVVDVWPIPDSGTTGRKIHFMYVETPSDMAADTDVPPVPEHFHDPLVDGAIVKRLATYVSSDRDSFASFVANWQKALKDAKRVKDVVQGRRDPLKTAGATHGALVDPRNYRFIGQTGGKFW